MTRFHEMTDPRRIAELAVRAAQAGDEFHLPLMRAAMMGAIDCVFLAPGSRAPARFLDRVQQQKPLIVVLGGDGEVPCGPRGFPQAVRLLRWCGFAMLHGAGGLPWHAGVAIEAAHLLQRVLIAESTGTILPDWVDLKARVAPTTPGLIIAVPDGKPQHPRGTAPAGAVIQ